MPRASVWLALLLALASPARAAQLWVAWELDLQDHAPPTHFVLTVDASTGIPVPPPMDVPWASCSTVPDAQHCAPIGCPPVGTYRFWVQAVYADGVSGRSNIATCAVQQAQCACVPGQPSPPTSPPVVTVPPGATAPPITRPAGLTLSSEMPPLVQVDPASLHLQPVGAIPTTAAIPSIPDTVGT